MASKTLKIILILVFLSVISFFTFGPSQIEKTLNRVVEHDPYVVSESTQRFHDALIIGDMHSDSTLWNRDLRKRSTFGHVDIPRMREGNHALQVFTTVTKSPRGLNYQQNSSESLDDITLLATTQLWPVKTWGNLTERALYQANRLHKIADKAPDDMMLILSKQDLDEFLALRHQGDKIVGALIGTEGSHALEGKLENVKTLYDAGFRMMSLQHFFDNRLGGSLHGISKAGLTEFGKQVTQKIDEMPIILDVSHSSEQVVRDVLAMVKNPIVVSHTGTYGHCPIARNISDELMQQIAFKGGVIGIGFWDAVCDYTPRGIARAIKAAIKLLGEDHVALGSDFDGSVETTMDVSELSALTQALINEGISKQTIRKVMGENMIRIFRQQLP